MASKRDKKRDEPPQAANQYDTAAPEWQIYRDLEGVVRLGVIQAELLKNVQSQLKAILPRAPQGPS